MRARARVIFRVTKVSPRSLPHQTVEFRGRGLEKAGFLLQAQDADGFQQAQGAHAVDVGGVFRGFEGNRHVAHGPQVVNFIGLHRLNDADQVGGITQIA